MRAASCLVAFLALPFSVLAQAPGSGDPSFPKDKPGAPTPTSPPSKRDAPGGPKREMPSVPDDSRSLAGLVDLRPKFHKGQETRYTLKIKSDNDLGIPSMVPDMDLSRPKPPTPAPISPTPTKPGQPAQPTAPADNSTRQVMDEEIGFVIRVTKEASQEDGATVELVYERLKVSLKHGDSEIFYDSTAPKRPNDDSDLMEPFFKGIVGSRIAIKFDANGNIKDIQGGDGGTMPGMMQQAGLDPKSIGSLFGPISSSKSGKGLYKVGEKWNNVDDVDNAMIGRFRMVTEHNLRSANPLNADVYFTGRIEPGSESGRPGSPFQIKDSRYQGKYTWDTALGQLKSMESEQEITLDSAAAQGKNLKAKTTVRVERDQGGKRK